MIARATLSGKEYDLLNTKNVDTQKNAFTIVVGKNGTGKSRLLGNIASGFIGKLNLRYLGLQYIQNGHFGDYETIGAQPSKLIAVSTSPFDRFPLLQPESKIRNTRYSYLGIRELMTRNFGLAYMSNIIASLIEAAALRQSQISEITNVLSYLGYSDSIKIRIQSRITKRFIDEITAAGPDYFHEVEKTARTPYMGFNRHFFYKEGGSVNPKKVAHLIKIFSKKDRAFTAGNRYVNLEIHQHGIHVDDGYSVYLGDIHFLLKSGLLRLRNVTLTKLEPPMPFPIADASSGEQAVVLSILGIASQIEDNSVICIDEPEICLHPEWQERYIQLLTSTFEQSKGCHFIIATHSPQIVSNLEPANSYILSLETGETTDAIEYTHRSSDFQLATVFNSPGFKNEYLSRIALNVFAKVSKNKIFDQEDSINYDLLRNQSQFLSEEDPVFQLFNAINEMHQTYGRH